MDPTNAIAEGNESDNTFPSSGSPVALVASVTDRSQLRGTLRLGVAETIVHTWLPRFVEAMSALLLGRHEGAFNVAGDGLMTLRECSEIIGAPIKKMPLRAYRGLARTMWAARLSEAPPGQIAFGIYPWIVSTEKLERETGWRPAHTSRETFEITMRTHGKLPPAEAPATSAAGNELPAEVRSGVA